MHRSASSKVQPASFANVLSIVTVSKKKGLSVVTKYWCNWKQFWLYVSHVVGVDVAEVQLRNPSNWGF